MLANAIPPALRRSLSRAFLVLGLLGGGMFLFDKGPREQALVFQFDEPRPLTKMTVTFSTEDGEPLRSFTLYRGPKAERIIEHQLELANGRYRFQVEVFFVEQPPGSARSDAPTAKPSRIVNKLVTLEGGKKVILL